MSKSAKQTGQAAPRSSGVPAWLALAVLAGAVGGVYGRALDAPFIFDDSVSVLQNRSIATFWPLLGDAEHPGPLNPPVEIPTSARPLVNLSFAINYHFGQFDPRGYRLFNVAICFCGRSFGGRCGSLISAGGSTTRPACWPWPSHLFGPCIRW
jgi:hypothetical protein